MALAVPSLVMVCMDSWTLEIMVLMAGTLAMPDVAVAAMGIAFNLNNIFYMVGRYILHMNVRHCWPAIIFGPVLVT